MTSSNCDTSKLIKKSQVGGMIEPIAGTAVNLTAFDFKTRIYVGAGAEYNAGREKRDLARASLTQIGSVEGKKSSNISFKAEVNNPDNWNVLATADLDIESILYQSGSTNRVEFNGTPDLSGVSVGNYLTVNYEGNSINNGTFLIIAIDDGNDTVDIVNRPKDSSTGDTVSLSAGVGDIQSAFEFSWMFASGGCKLDGLSRLPIGAVTSGPFVHGETITGATSSATGMVIVPAKTGDANLYFLPLTGKFQAEVIDGATAQATSSAGPNVHGMIVRPTSDCMEVATVAYQEDGYEWSLRSGVCNITGDWGSNAPGFFESEFQGPRLSNGDQDLTPNVIRGIQDPPIMKTADLTFDATTTNFKPVFTKVGFDMGNEITLRENGNASDDTGYETGRITGREPKVNISLEMELASTFDYFDKLDEGTKTALQLHIGTSANNQFWFFAKELELQALPPGDADGIRTLELEAMCTGDISSADDEWIMAFIGD